MNMQICPDCFKEYEMITDVCPNCGYVLRSDKREAYHLPVGSVLDGKYVIGRVIGNSGFGNTYKSWDINLERYIVVTEYFPNSIVNRVPGSKEVIVCTQKYAENYERGKAYFNEETRCTANFLRVQSIVDVYDFFEENNTIYRVSELLDCVTLRSYVAKSEHKRLEYKEACRIILQVAEALKALHEKKIIHRAVNPSNILICSIDDNKKAKLLIDYGEMKLRGTEKISCILSPGYTALEQYMELCRGRKYKQGPWTDVYALGATMYHMITGIRPEESINRKIKDTVLYPHKIDSAIPIKLSKAIMKAMAVDIRKRYKKVEAFVKEIKKYIIEDINSCSKAKFNIKLLDSDSEANEQNKEIKEI